MRIIFLWMVIVLANNTNCQEYRTYNNIVTIANKLNVAESYEEANLVYESAFKLFERNYKSIDLFYWAVSLVHCGEKKLAFKRLLMASERSNDAYNIYYFTKNQNEFSFLTDAQLEKIKLSERKVDLKTLNKSLLKQIMYLDSVDTYWQNFYIDSVIIIDENDPIRNDKVDLFEEMMKTNSSNFCDFILKNGYPNYMETNFSTSHLLYHLHTNHWEKIENKLLEGLNNGYLRPFDYAYAYLRTHNEDRYGAMEFIEIETRNEPIEKKILKEMGYKGLGI